MPETHQSIKQKYAYSQFQFLYPEELKQIKKILDQSTIDFIRGKIDASSSEKILNGSEMLDYALNPQTEFSGNIYNMLSSFKNSLGAFEAMENFSPEERNLFKTVRERIPKKYFESQIRGENLSAEEQRDLLNNMRYVLKWAGGDATWLENLQNLEKMVLIKNLPVEILNADGKSRTVPRAATIPGNQIFYNVGPSTEYPEGINFYSDRGQAILLHEFRHLYQNNALQWQHCAPRDIAREVDAFDKQIDYLHATETPLPKFLLQYDSYKGNQSFQNKKIYLKNYYNKQGVVPEYEDRCGITPEEF